MLRTIISFIGGFLVGLAVLGIWQFYATPKTVTVPAQESTLGVPIPQQTPESPSEEENEGIVGEQAGEEQVAGNARVRVEAQKSGQEVVVTEVQLQHDGWVVVHEERDEIIANALGAVRKNAGTHTAVHIPLLRSTTAGNRYWVVLYTDDNDRMFSLETDAPVRTTTGVVVMSAFETQ